MALQPLPASTKSVSRTVLACGAWLKNAACLLQNDTVCWTPLHGDLGDP
ncbi:MAG: carbamoyltransferase HypF, partial [bacterium]